MVVRNKNYYLEEELYDIKTIFESANKLLAEIDNDKSHYFCVLRLYSEGLERLFKISIALFYWEDTEKIKDKTQNIHDLEKLFDRVIGAYGSNERINKIKNNSRVKTILEILSYFAKYGRYYNLDIICGNSREEDSPKVLWESIETDISSEDLEENNEDSYKKINEEILRNIKLIVNETCNIVLNHSKKIIFLNDFRIEAIKL